MKKCENFNVLKLILKLLVYNLICRSDIFGRYHFQINWVCAKGLTEQITTISSNLSEYLCL